MLAYLQGTDATIGGANLYSNTEDVGFGVHFTLLGGKPRDDGVV